MKRFVFFSVLCAVLFLAGVVIAQTGVKKKRPLPYEFGRVTMNNFSESAKIPGVAFDHWVHRARFTCRVCHVDIGFGMKAGTTNVRAADNMKGFYCGTCHNGRMSVNGKKLFEACSQKVSRADFERCARCHSLGREVKLENDFTTFAQKLPKERFGNGIDWEKAENSGLIKPSDFIEGVSIKRPPLKINPDFELNPQVQGMPDIIFSHKKHTVWNGCELCHPEIFVGIKRGQTKYSMTEIFSGKYCGVCHVSVAFPLIDCQRCHAKPVQQS
jgi:c(7)-type cytochrome triheme protein